MHGNAIYVIDDDPAMRDSMQAMLQARGLRAETFANVSDFLARYNETASGGCLLIDMNMPGTSGIDALWTLAEHGVRMPSILMTGRTSGSIEAQARAAGFSATILKPFQPAMLIELIARTFTNCR